MHCSFVQTSGKALCFSSYKVKIVNKCSLVSTPTPAHHYYHQCLLSRWVPNILHIMKFSSHLEQSKTWLLCHKRRPIHFSILYFCLKFLIKCDWLTFKCKHKSLDRPALTLINASKKCKSSSPLKMKHSFGLTDFHSVP